MRILVCHNQYAIRTGEALVVEMQVRLLREAGHEVAQFTYDNADINHMSSLEALASGLRAIYSRQTVRDLTVALQRHHFDVVHVHNTWPLMSPSVFRAAARQGLPVIATVHNFRWLCPAATLFRRGRICRDCIDKPGGTIHAAAHRCYRKSFLASAVAAISLTVNRDVLRVYDRDIDRIVVQSPFVRRLLVANGFADEKLSVIGNVLDRTETRSTSAGGYIVFAGRLEDYKGVRTLLSAARGDPFPLRIFGVGPLAALVEQAAAEAGAGDRRVSYGGLVPRDVVLREIAACAAVVVPSEWYESCPNAVVEAMAHGKPVIASRIGSLPDLVEDGTNGLLFEPGNAGALATCVHRVLDDGALRDRLGRGARATFEASMAPESLVDRLLDVYRLAGAGRVTRSPDA